MKPAINLSRDGKRIQIFIPAQLGRHSGRKTILSPTGQPVEQVSPIATRAIPTIRGNGPGCTNSSPRSGEK